MQLSVYLSELETNGLIRLTQAVPELEYLFRHALVQEVAYDSLVKADRRKLHQAIGEALEQLYPGRRDTREMAPLLARHFHEAGDTARALHYFTLAGTAAAAAYANIEAATHYAQALRLAGQAPLDRDRLLHIYTQRGRALELGGRFAEAESNYRGLEALGEKRADRSLMLEGLIRRATLYVVPTSRMDAGQGAAVAQQALELARELGNRAAEARSLWNLALSAKFAGRYEETIDLGEQAIAISRELGLREQLALTLNDIYPGYLIMGQTARALTALEEAQGLWRQLGNLPLLADSLTNTGQLYLYQGKLASGYALMEEALQITRSIGNLWGQAYALTSLSLGYVSEGEWGRALAVLQEAVGLAEEAGFVVAQISAPAMMGQIYGMAGDVPRGLELAHRALEMAGESTQYGWITALGALAALYLLQGDLEQAEHYLTEGWRASGGSITDETVPLAIVQGDIMLAKHEYAALLPQAEAGLRQGEQYGIVAYRPDSLRHLGLALLGLGRVAEARAALEEGHALALKLGLRQPRLALLAGLVRLEQEAGDPERAADYGREAAEVIERIAASLGDPALREKFLARADVREILGNA